MATLLLDARMPLEQRLEPQGCPVQKFSRPGGSGRPGAKLIATIPIYAETSLRGMGQNDVKALEKRGEGKLEECGIR